jgi:hypothetical protein
MNTKELIQQLDRWAKLEGDRCSRISKNSIFLLLLTEDEYHRVSLQPPTPFAVVRNGSHSSVFLALDLAAIERAVRFAIVSQGLLWKLENDANDPGKVFACVYDLESDETFRHGEEFSAEDGAIASLSAYLQWLEGRSGA